MEAKTNARRVPHEEGKVRAQYKRRDGKGDKENGAGLPRFVYCDSSRWVKVGAPSNQPLLLLPCCCYSRAITHILTPGCFLASWAVCAMRSMLTTF